MTKELVKINWACPHDCLKWNSYNHSSIESLATLIKTLLACVIWPHQKTLYECPSRGDGPAINDCSLCNWRKFLETIGNMDDLQLDNLIRTPKQSLIHKNIAWVHSYFNVLLMSFHWDNEERPTSEKIVLSFSISKAFGCYCICIGDKLPSERLHTPPLVQ